MIAAKAVQIFSRALLVSLALLCLVSWVPGSTLAYAQDPATGLSNAEANAASADAEIEAAQAEVSPAETRLRAASRQAAPVIAAARGARAEVARLKASSNDARVRARSEISGIEETHQGEVDDHGEAVRNGLGFGLAFLLLAFVALTWDRFRASAAVAAFTRLPSGQAIGLSAFGCLLLVVIGAVLAGVGGPVGVLGVAVASLALGLSVAFLLARRSAQIQAGGAKPILGRERWPAWGLRTIAALFLLLAVAGFAGAIGADSPKEVAISSQLEQAAHGVLASSSKRELAAAKARMARLGPMATRLASRRTAARQALRKARLQLQGAERRLARAEQSAAHYSRQLVAIEQMEAREAEQRAEEEAEEAEEAEEFEEETSACDPNYTGCVPNTGYDVDCAEVSGPVEVIGVDVDGLDADSDGVGCEY